MLMHRSCAGDIIEAIGEQSCKGMTLTVANDLLQGKPNSHVAVTVRKVETQVSCLLATSAHVAVTVRRVETQVSCLFASSAPILSVGHKFVILNLPCTVRKDNP